VAPGPSVFPQPTHQYQRVAARHPQETVEDKLDSGSASGIIAATGARLWWGARSGWSSGQVFASEPPPLEEDNKILQAVCGVHP